MRAQIMTQIASTEGRKIVRMGPETFLDLCDKLQQFGRLFPTRQATVEEQVAKTLYILTHNVRNREIQFWFRRSGETTSRHFHRVIRSLIELEDKYLKQPDGSEIPLEILGNNKFYPYFKDCVGAIDGTHVRVKVSSKDAPKYRGRKDFPTQNVLVACSFDLRFTYVLCGWEGTASDSRVLKNALCRSDPLNVPTDPDEELIAEVDEELANQSPSQHRNILRDDDDEYARLGENLRDSIATTMWRDYSS
ncbi:putative nuclease HARBI1 isoform X1 [Senna tora]|uniref:Putative nuclease HARBI1 isoform X1 n=1 Tax=Senna tora TaxID=362788 RepID=A0A834X926_9FABA|nr:putative nuclease HARBI1 isoform X1 [Senna tora]